MADKLTTDGVMRVESLGPNKVKRVIDFSVDAKIFAVGGMFGKRPPRRTCASPMM